MNKDGRLITEIAFVGFVLALIAMTAGCSRAPEPQREAARDIARDTLAQQQFTRGIGNYIAVHANAEKNLPHIRNSKSGVAIVARQHVLASNVAAARTKNNFKEGDIFTPEVAAYFHREIEAAYMQNADGIQSSLENAKGPGDVHVAVNQSYPEDIDYTVVPPTLLLRLPKLPEGIQYEIVGRDLILRDTECNLVIDAMRNALPA